VIANDMVHPCKVRTGVDLTLCWCTKSRILNSFRQTAVRILAGEEM